MALMGPWATLFMIALVGGPSEQLLDRLPFSLDAVGEIGFEGVVGSGPADRGGFDAGQTQPLGEPGDELVEFSVVREWPILLPCAQSLGDGAACRERVEEREAKAWVNALLVVEELAEEGGLDGGTTTAARLASAFLGGKPVTGGADDYHGRLIGQ